MERPKSTAQNKPVATPKSKSEPIGPAVLHEQGGKRPNSRPWRTTIEDEWARHDRNRGRLKDALPASQAGLGPQIL
jgi:hypothetical protein